MGSSNYITNLAGQITQSMAYMPFGELLADEHLNSYNTPFKFNAKEYDAESGLYYYGARYYDPKWSMWLSVDPMAEEAPDWTPYRYGFHNPIRFIDSHGMFEENPVYGSDGSFRGGDEHGLQGEAIIYDGEFTNGMAQSEILDSGGMTFSNLSNYERWKFMDKGWSHWKTLYQRPDWDGFVTIQEGIDWAIKHPGAKGNPTPDNTLYLDASKLDFGNITISDFKNGVGKSSPINLLNLGNLVSSVGNKTLRATVYALGRVDMQLFDKAGTVTIINNSATDYDWNPGGGTLRNSLIRAELARTGLNDSHGFKTFYYGKGSLNPVP